MCFDHFPILVCLATEGLTSTSTADYRKMGNSNSKVPTMQKRSKHKYICSIDHVTCLHFAWPFRVPGWFPAGEKWICTQSLCILYFSRITSRILFNFQMNKIGDVMLVPYPKITQILWFLTNRANVHTPMWKSYFKTQHGRIPIDPAILTSVGHRL